MEMEIEVASLTSLGPTQIAWHAQIPTSTCILAPFFASPCRNLSPFRPFRPSTFMVP